VRKKMQDYARPRVGGQCGTQFTSPSGAKGRDLLPTKTSRLWTQSLGRSEKRRRTGSQVSFTLRTDCSSLFILVAIILSSMSRVLIILSQRASISLSGVYMRRILDYPFASYDPDEVGGFGY
jgi:hypothetical protein